MKYFLIVNRHVTAVLHILLFIGSTFFRKGENIQFRHTHQVLFKVLNSESVLDETNKIRFSLGHAIGCLTITFHEKKSNEHHRYLLNFPLSCETVRWIRSCTRFEKRTFSKTRLVTHTANRHPTRESNTTRLMLLQSCVKYLPQSNRKRSANDDAIF